MKERALKIFKRVPGDIEAVILMNDVEPLLDPAFFYATGASSGLFEGAAVILWPDGRTELLASELEETSARSTDAEVKVFRRALERDKMLTDSLAQVKKLGVCGSGLTYRALQEIRKVSQAELVDVWKDIEAARMIKDAKEIENIREACRIGSEAGKLIPSFLQEGMNETTAAAELNYLMQKLGASAPSFATNASFGPSAAEPHHSPGTDRLRKGDYALFDFGAMFNRYGSDITRTFFYHRASRRQKEMYEVVREAQQAGFDAIRAGVNGKDVDAAARAVIDASPFKGGFIHSLGHGLGLSVHDGGRMAPGADMELQENMILTVEPGVYVRGEGGVRIEDDIRVTKEGYELLTFTSRDLLVV